MFAINTTVTQPVLDNIASKSWAKKTDSEIMQALNNLPESWSGFLADLAERPDVIGGLEVVKMATLNLTGFSATCIFEVLNANGSTGKYQYFSWRHGPNSGVKGVVFIRSGNTITHFVVLRAEKFAPAKHVWDTLGGFNEGTFGLQENALREIREELGTNEIEISEVYDLGRIMTDAGMTNNRPGIFAAIVDVSQATKIDSEPVNLDEFEVKAGVFVMKMSQLPEMMMGNEDTFFISAVARSVIKGIIPATALFPSN